MERGVERPVEQRVRYGDETVYSRLKKGGQNIVECTSLVVSYWGTI